MNRKSFYVLLVVFTIAMLGCVVGLLPKSTFPDFGLSDHAMQGVGLGVVSVAGVMFMILSNVHVRD